VEKEPMKVAVLHSSLMEYGGAEHVIEEEARWLLNKGHSVRIVVSAYDPNSSLGKAATAYLWNFRLPKLKHSIPNALTSVLTVVAARRLDDYDALLSHHLPGPIVAYQASRRYEIPYVSYVHHPPKFLYPNPIHKRISWGYDYDRAVIEELSKYNPWLRDFDRRAIRAASSVLVNSRVIEKAVETTYKVQASLCYPGVRIERSPTKPDIEGIDGDYILSTGRQTPQKGLDLLLGIFRMVRSRGKTVRLLVVGPQTEYTKYLRVLSARFGLGHDIDFINFLTNEELAWLYTHAQAYVFPAMNEDFGLGPLEAMSYGTPAIAWSEYGPQETIVDGKTGFLVKPYDINSFAHSICTILSDCAMRTRMGEAAREHVANNFTWEKHGKILEQHLLSAIEARKAG
jgi:glycosyltransferase involved in cell wall biosynthesis